MNYLKLSELHTDIWWQHDAKQFTKMEKTIFDFLVRLNYDKKKSKKASRLIKESYQEYDKALKTSNFEKMGKKLIQAMLILGFKKQNGKDYAKWWICFSKKEKIKIIKSLFNYHLNFFRGIKKLFVPLLLCLIIMAGLLGHNKRNKNITKFFLIFYWIIIRYINKKFILF